MSHGAAASICNSLEISGICCNRMQHGVMPFVYIKYNIIIFYANTFASCLADFDSAIRRFESSRPSHAFSETETGRGLWEKGREFGAFARGAAALRLSQGGNPGLNGVIPTTVSVGDFSMSGFFEEAT